MIGVVRDMDGSSFCFKASFRLAHPLRPVRFFGSAPALDQPEPSKADPKLPPLRNNLDMASYSAAGIASHAGTVGAPDRSDKPANDCATRQAPLRLLFRVAESNRLLVLLNAGDVEKAELERRHAAPDLTSLLAAVAQHRDRAAFATLFQFYSPRLKGYLVGRGATATTAEEIVQDVMLTLWHKSQQFDVTRGSASAWIFTLARNAFIDCVRREHRPVVDPADPLLRAQANGDTPDQLVLDAESLRELAAAMDALPAEQLHVVHCSYFRGQSLAEISVADRLPIGTVKTRARLALSRLRALVTKRRET